MFGIPADQQLTARQVFNLFTAMAEVDASVKSKLQPANFFGMKSEDGRYTNKVWLTREQLRDFEAALKQRFMDWLETDSEKLVAVLRKLDVNVRSDLDMRSKPFDQRRFALRQHIVPLVDHLHKKKLLPAICFSEDRHLCEVLARTVGDELVRRERRFLDSAEYKEEFGQQLKDAEKQGERNQAKA